MSTQSTTTTTTETKAPTGDIKVFIDTFNSDFDIEISNLVKIQQNYKNVYADAIKITTPKKGPWPNDPKVVTIGDLFKYTFPDIDSGKIIAPTRYNTNEYENYNGWVKDLPNNEDPKISEMYSTISNGIQSVKKLETYQSLKKPGITNPNLWSPGQYYFDVFMYLMLSPSGPLKDPTNANGGAGAFGANVISGYSFAKTHGGSVSISYFDPSGEVELSKHEDLNDPKLDYYEFYDVLDSGYSDSSIRDRIFNITGVAIGLGDQSSNKPVSFPNLKTQYRSGILSDLIQDPKFNRTRGKIEDASGNYVGVENTYGGKEISGYKFTGNYEHILLYKAFVQAGDNYQPVVLPVKAPETPAQPEAEVKQVVQLPQEVGYTFNVETKDTFVIVGGSMSGAQFTIVPNDGTTYITNEAPINNLDDEDMLGDEYLESNYQGSEESLLDLSNQLQVIGDLQAELDPNTKGSDFTVDDANINDGKYVGAVWKSFNIDTAVSKINSTKFKPSSKFTDSLKKVLYYIKNDPDINDLREGAYILGTAYAESGYSLQRWEADYACSGAGIPYGPGGPCGAATKYYRSSSGKKNYYELGTDSKGQCYFGRGLIQLTGKGNYEKYGKLIGVDLLGNGDLALDPQNSYKIASTYMRGRTFKKVLSNDLTGARKSVNGGTKGINEVNGAYSAWVNVLKELSTPVA